MISWLFLFFIHSTLWFSLAWLVTRLAPRMDPQTRETVWYTAIVVSLVTPSLHLIAPGGVLSIWSLTLPGALFPSMEPGLLIGEHAPSSSAGISGFNWEVLLLGSWVSTAGVLLLRYLAQVMLIRRRLARQDVPADSQEAITLRRLSRRAGLGRPPRLTESENLGSPIAFGVGALAEICVPIRALHELDQEQFSAMLGHEIAHHQRLDPIRLGIMNIMRGLFFFQPLFRVAGRDVHWAAEEQCDALAANHVQDRLALASCLTEVAGWVLPRERRLPMVGMAGGRSHLVRRVDRLIDDKSPSGGGGRVWRRLGSASVLVFAPFLAPELSLVTELSHETSAPARSELTASPLEHRDAPRQAEGEHRDGSVVSSDEGGEAHVAEPGNETGGEHGDEGRERNEGEHRQP